MADEAHPFVPGTKVAITHRYGGIDAAVVSKVYKTGNFTLAGMRQQWRPTKSWGGTGWEAVETGGGYTRSTLHVWTEADDAAIEQTKRTREAQALVENLRRYLDRISAASLNELRAMVKREAK